MDFILAVLIGIYVVWSIWYIRFKDHTVIVTNTVEVPVPKKKDRFPRITSSLISHTDSAPKYYWAWLNGQWELKIHPQSHRYLKNIIYPDLPSNMNRTALYLFAERVYSAKEHEVFIWEPYFALSHKPKRKLRSGKPRRTVRKSSSDLDNLFSVNKPTRPISYHWVRADGRKF